MLGLVGRTASTIPDRRRLRRRVGHGRDARAGGCSEIRLLPALPSAWPTGRITGHRPPAVSRSICPGRTGLSNEHRCARILNSRFACGAERLCGPSSGRHGPACSSSRTTVCRRPGVAIAELSKRQRQQGLPGGEPTPRERRRIFTRSRNTTGIDERRRRREFLVGPERPTSFPLSLRRNERPAF
jgi:hypothetical protein